MSRRRNVTNTSKSTQVAAVAQQLSKRLDAPISSFRLVEIRYFDGRQWTVHTTWQQLIDEQWREVSWTALQE